MDKLSLQLCSVILPSSRDRLHCEHAFKIVPLVGAFVAQRIERCAALARSTWQEHVLAFVNSNYDGGWEHCQLYFRLVHVVAAVVVVLYL